MDADALKNAVGSLALLNTGYSISMVGLGTYKVVGQEIVMETVDSALSTGYRLFDTAKYYKNEPELGSAFEMLLPKYGLCRSDIFITTKFFPAKSGNTEYARKMISESLNNLRTNYIDLVLIHYPKSDECENDDPTNRSSRKDLYLELLKCKEEGVIRSVGVSNYEVRHIEEIKEYSNVVPAVNQVEFHPHFSRNELREYCVKHGVFFQAYSSLARMNSDLISDPVITKIAASHDTTPQMILLAWPLNIGVGILPKSSTSARVAENIKATDIKLTKEEIRDISCLNRNKNYIRCQGWEVM